LRERFEVIEFRSLADDEPALRYSPLLSGVLKTFAYVHQHGCIGLTPSKAFKRSFVNWAAYEFDFPAHSAAELFAVNKVLNEHDFMPLGAIHFLLITLKMGRHYKGQFKLTKAGIDVSQNPARLFGVITPFYLFELDHSSWSRTPGQTLLGNWDVFLNILNVETEDGAAGAHLRRTLFGEPDPNQFPRHDEMMGRLYTQILRPLVWTGFLQETRLDGSLRARDSLFTKTPLWKAALKLDTESMVNPATRH
jgi:hypothetical protein